MILQNEEFCGFCMSPSIAKAAKSGMCKWAGYVVWGNKKCIQMLVEKATEKLGMRR